MTHNTHTQTDHDALAYAALLDSETMLDDSEQLQACAGYDSDGLAIVRKAALGALYQVEA